MDVRMPGMDGIEATRRIVSGVSTTRVLILTTFDLDEYAYAGLRGYGPPPANLGILIMASAFRLAEQDEIPHMSLCRHVLIRDGGRRR
jgi:CheY-like chemotaxis protein